MYLKMVKTTKWLLTEAPENERCDPHLVFNFDQVWTLNFEHASKVLWKSSKDCGIKKDELSKARHRQKMRAVILEALGTLQPTTNENAPAWTARLSKLEGVSTLTAVERWRQPRTTTTLSWATGELGRAFITVGDGAIPSEEIESLNVEFRDHFVISSTGRTSHMWDAAMTLKFLDFMSVELRMQRRKYGLTAKSRALCIYDKAEFVVITSGCYT